MSNDISKHKILKIDPGGIFFAPAMFMGSWTKHNFMHGIFANVKFGQNLYFHAFIVTHGYCIVIHVNETVLYEKLRRQAKEGVLN